jgi:lysophospholipase L1-like esterase
MANLAITQVDSSRTRRSEATARGSRRVSVLALAAACSSALAFAGCSSDEGQDTPAVTTAGSGAGQSSAGAAAGSGGSSAADSGDDPGEGDGKDVITIGDSYMSLLVTGIQQSLEKISKRDYRNYAFPGTLVLNEQIPNQFTMALAEDADIKTVVMTGGGNDVLTGTCTGSCEEIVDKVGVRLDTLYADMATAGVQDVILVSYGYPADESRHASLDYSRSLLPKRCSATGMPRCHFIDPVEQLAGKIGSDGIHPTAEGYDILGQLVWDLMQSAHVRR